MTVPMEPNTPGRRPYPQGQPAYPPPQRARPQVDARMLWSGGVATAVVAGLIALVGVLVSRWLFNIPILAPKRYGAYGDAHTTTLVLVAAGAALVATLLADDGLSPDALDAADGVITTAAVAIAETGTIILDGGPGQGRRALSLIPDYHLCILGTGQIAGIVPEALARLEPGRPCTWISGPSATSDIELDRVQGVHGPRTLEVILVEP